jgi:FAD/FMN-containing dehydrogenase
VVLAESKNNVSLALKTIKFLKLKFATRSRGHSPNPRWSSIGEHGILIDLQKLNAINVSADKKVATIGPGKRWREVYEALNPHELSVIEGHIPRSAWAG